MEETTENHQRWNNEKTRKQSQLEIHDSTVITDDTGEILLCEVSMKEAITGHDTNEFQRDMKMKYIIKNDTWMLVDRPDLGKPSDISWLCGRNWNLIQKKKCETGGSEIQSAMWTVFLWSLRISCWTRFNSPCGIFDCEVKNKDLVICRNDGLPNWESWGKGPRKNAKFLLGKSYKMPSH